jgi:hypothetical protein
MVLPDCLEAIWHSRYESVSMEILILENLIRFTAETVKRFPVANNLYN